MIEFFSGTHEYKFQGRKVPGVTSTLKAAGILQAWGKPEDLERGRNVHKMIHAWFDKDLNEINLPEWLQPYLDGVKNFVADTGFTAIDWEQPVHDKIHGYAGTYDVRGKLRGQRLQAIVDFKSGDIASWTKIQTAAYTLGKPFLRMAVGISPGLNGGKNYNCKVYGVETLAAHLRVYYASLTVARFLQEE